MRKVTLFSISIVLFFPPISRAQQTFDWQKQVIYFILIDRFHNGDSANDRDVSPKDPYAYHGGDLEGVIKRLPYLKDLGVTVLWLSPVFDNRDDRFFQYWAYHGYWPKDFFKVEERFGEMDTLKRLSRAAQEKGMHLVLDMIVNHVDYNAPMVQEKPEWFHPYPAIQDWSNPLQIERYRVHGLPDFAQENPDVARYLTEMSKWWIDQIHPVGFRLDAVKHVPLSFWKHYNRAMREHAGNDFFILGELLDGDPLTCSRYLNEGQFSSLFDFPFHFVLKRVIAQQASAEQLGTLFYNDRLYERPQFLATLLDNHDLERFLSSVQGDIEKLKLALAFLFTVRGIPTIYYGTEVGLTGEREPFNRSDMNFDLAPSLREHVRKLIGLRLGSSALTTGKQVHLHQTPSSYVFARISFDQVSVVASNVRTKESSLDIPLQFLSSCLPEGKATDALGGVEAVVAEGRMRLTLPGLGCAVFLFAPGLKELNALQKRYEEEREKTIPVTFELVFPEESVEVHVIGGHPLLGKWSPAQAPGPMTYLGQKRYRIQLELPKGSVLEYKYIQRKKDQTVWELGLENRYLQVPYEGSIRINDQWERKGH